MKRLTILFLAVILVECATSLRERSSREVNAIAFSPDGRTLAVGMAKYWQTMFTPVPDIKKSMNIVKLWDVTTGQERITLEGHTERVTSVVFSPEGNILATGGGW